VPEKLVPQARAFGSSFDEPGDIGDHKAAIDPDTNHPEMRMQGGERVVCNLGRAAETARMKVDFPALGSPSNPISASTFSSSLSVRCSPGSPGVAFRGVRLVLDLKLTLPRPLCLPREQCDLLVLGEVSDRFPGLRVRDHGTRGHAQYDIIGTFSVALGTAPALAVPGAVNAREAIFDEGVDVSVGDRIDAAPLPPSPPSGPPRGTFFSRRKLTAPSPPLPEWISMHASSTNFHGACGNKKALSRG